MSLTTPLVRTPLRWCCFCTMSTCNPGRIVLRSVPFIAFPSLLSILREDEDTPCSIVLCEAEYASEETSCRCVAANETREAIKRMDPMRYSVP